MNHARIIKKYSQRLVSEITHRSFGKEWPDIPRVFLCNTSAYRNIGDHAITLAEREFLEKYFPGRQIIEITSDEWRRFASSAVKKYVKSDDVFFIHGGGYFGTQWGGGEEDSALDIMSFFPKNTFIVFPQTVFYENSEYGAKLKSDRISQYSKIPNITLFVREANSLKVAKEMNCFGGGVYLVPDIVLSLDRGNVSNNRNGALLCFRNDEEKAISDSIEGLKSSLEEHGLSVGVTDTVASESFPFSERFNVVEKKISQFAASKIVVTDRLHAMIMCAISCTPCVALNNTNGKVFGVYQWIKHLPYIEICSDVSALIDQVLNFSTAVEDQKLIWTGLSNEYDRMARIIGDHI